MTAITFDECLTQWHNYREFDPILDTVILQREGARSVRSTSRIEWRRGIAKVATLPDGTNYPIGLRTSSSCGYGGTPEDPIVSVEVMACGYKNELKDELRKFILNPKEKRDPKVSWIWRLNLTAKAYVYEWEGSPQAEYVTIEELRRWWVRNAEALSQRTIFLNKVGNDGRGQGCFWTFRLSEFRRMLRG